MVLDIKRVLFSISHPIFTHYLYSHLVFIVNCQASLSHPPTTLVWYTLGWISTFGRERRRVSFDHPRPWMRRSWRESALSAPVTAACLIGPSPRCWHDMMGDDTEQQHVGSEMLVGASGRQRPWQTPLYSFNPKVLKQHLTQIEVGFVCCRGRERNMKERGNIRRRALTSPPVPCSRSHSVYSEQVKCLPLCSVWDIKADI